MYVPDLYAVLLCDRHNGYRWYNTLILKLIISQSGILCLALCFILIFFFVVHTKLYVAQMALNSWSALCLSSAGFTSVDHHAGPVPNENVIIQYNKC